jgi:hypothetical protein
MRTKLANGRTVEFNPTDVTSAATISVYRNGQCFALAAALSKRLNGTVAILVADDVEVPSAEDVETAWLTWTASVRHAVALSGDAVYDIAGARSIDEVLAESPGYRLHTVTNAHLTALHLVGTKQLHGAARISAKKLVEL